MGSNVPELYVGREQSLVKHTVLRAYLMAFARIVGQRWDSITYIDGFSGPWKTQGQKLEDTSFHIALSELKAAATELAAQGRDLALRCFFVEENPAAYAELERYAEAVTGAVVVTRNCTFEEALPEVIRFIQAGGTTTFPFVFIDPTGWTGFGMKAIQPLWQLGGRVEVLVNFMTQHIQRFIDDDDAQRQSEFRQLFGDDGPLGIPSGLVGDDRRDWMVQHYQESLKRHGAFEFVTSAIVLMPEKKTTHFNLIYATRDAKGIKAFKGAEKKAMAVQESARAEAQQRKRVSQSGQHELFGAQEAHDTTHYGRLRDRYLSAARAKVEACLMAAPRVSYDEAWTIAVLHSLVWESDLKDWISDWQKRGLLAIEGLAPKARVPQHGEGHVLVWLKA